MSDHICSNENCPKFCVCMFEQPLMLNADVLGKGREHCNGSLSLEFPDSPEVQRSVLICQQPMLTCCFLCSSIGNLLQIYKKHFSVPRSANQPVHLITKIFAVLCSRSLLEKFCNGIIISDLEHLNIYFMFLPPVAIGTATFIQSHICML